MQRSDKPQAFRLLSYSVIFMFINVKVKLINQIGKYKIEECNRANSGVYK